MVNEQTNQEIELHTTLGKKNKRKSKFIRNREGDFLFFYLLIQKKKEGIIFVFL
jgi:hypothetical protein